MLGVLLGGIHKHDTEKLQLLTASNKTTANPHGELHLILHCGGDIPISLIPTSPRYPSAHLSLSLSLFLSLSLSLSPPFNQ